MSSTSISDILRLELPLEPTDDQKRVIRLYLLAERLCVAAGAGVGKSTLLVILVVEIVLRQIGTDIANIEENPFSEILVCTFNDDAAAKLRDDIKSLLEHHESCKQQEFDDDLWDWLRDESYICTIDTFVTEELKERPEEHGLAPGLEAVGEVEKEQRNRDIIDTMQGDSKYREAIATLTAGLERDNETVPGFIHGIHQELRSMGHPVAEMDPSDEITYFSDQIRNKLYAGYTPPFSKDELAHITESVVGQRPGSSVDLGSKTDAIAAEYRYSVEFTQAVETVLPEFDRRYRKRVRASATPSHVDKTHMLGSLLRSESGEEVAESLNDKFSHIFIDEFQDTSPIQLDILRHLVRNGPDRNKIMIIGDLKQGIYRFRSAKPRLFAEILEQAEKNSAGPDPHLGATGWEKAEIETNFRSHPHLVWAGNQLFDTVFTDPARGAIGKGSTTPGPMIPYRDELRPNQSRLHAIPVEDFRDTPEKVARALKDALEDDSYKICSDGQVRPSRVGDHFALFRRKTNIDEFRRELEEVGIPSVFPKQQGLFGQPEISYVVDILDWLVSDSNEDLRSALETEVAPLSNEAVQHIETNDYDIDESLDSWPSNRLLTFDKKLLSRLQTLRSDLRWDREGRKAELLNRLSGNLGLEGSLLANGTGTREYGNLKRLVKLAHEWEEDGLMSYTQFTEKLGRLRRMAQEDGNYNFRLAPTSDPESANTLNIGTMHGMKGNEHHCILLVDLAAEATLPPAYDNSLKYRDQATGREELAILPRKNPATDDVEFSPGPGDYWVRNHTESTLVPTNTREHSSGDFEHNHPFQSGVRDAVEEYWRLFYVAFTRAQDHIFFEAPHDVEDSLKWSSMAPALNEVFKPSNRWEANNSSDHTFEFPLDPSSQNPKDPATFDSIPIAIQPLAAASSQSNDSSSHTELTQTLRRASGTAQSSNCATFIPKRIEANSVYELIACPHRHQLAELQNVSSSHGRSPPSGNVPAGLTGDQWGTTVHDEIELLHERISDDLAPSESLGPSLEQITGGELDKLLSTYGQTSTWREVREASRLHAELNLDWHVGTEPLTEFKGSADLVYRCNGRWTTVDYKTGKKPPQGSFLWKKHRAQVRAYAWALEERYGRSASTGRVVYLEPGLERNVKLDIDGFGDTLEQLSEGIQLVDGSRLPTRPDPDPAGNTAERLSAHTRCGSCPYSDICNEW